MHEQSHSRLFSALVICIIAPACRCGLLTITDNAITHKAQRDKNARGTEVGERG